MTIWLKMLYVFLMGGAGAVCRLLVKLYVQKLPENWMGLSTLVVNSLGCLLIGIFAGFLLTHNNWTDTEKQAWTLLLMTGFCGGFSTFSAFTLDCVHYFQDGKILIWVAFAAATVVFGFGLCFLGYIWGQRM